MLRGWKTRALLMALFISAVAGASAGVWRLGYVQALDTLAKQGHSDLTLAADRLTGQLQRYRELAVLMADHPVVAELSAGATPEAAQALFQGVADKTGALELLFVDPKGQVRAAARDSSKDRVSDAAFVTRAMQGALGAGHGADGLVAPRAYYFAAPSFASDSQVRGAIVVAADIAEIEWDWAASNPAVFFTDAQGEVFITNRSELIYWRRMPGSPGLAPPKGPARPMSATWVAGHELWRLDWGRYLPSNALHIERPLPVIGMTAEALIDTAPALRLAGLQAAALAALSLAFGAMLFLATERRRTLAEANTKLEARVTARTQDLSRINTQLRREIAEREEAEAALRQAQQDLVQAGKLSALGQMSAGISHELNQPLMALQTFAENGAAFLARGESERAAKNLARISDMAGRIGRIIRNLRAFARQESAPVGRVDLTRVLTSTVELAAARLREGDVTLRFEPPAEPLWVQGGEVRLGQVFVNLITNAVDAMEGRETRVLSLTVRDGARLTVEVADTGPGIDVPDKVFEPFYSTKLDAGQDGMGLGLSISYGIVQSFGGDIRGQNGPEGAVFTVELERWTQQEQAA